MARRGLTLVEVLVALALVLALMALALPAVEGRLAEARFDAALRQTEAAMMVARAEAQRQGKPIRLVARPVRGGELGLFMEAVDPATAAGDPGDSGAAGAAPATGAAAQSGVAWAVLPAKVTVSETPPPEAGETGGAATEISVEPKGAPPSPVTLAVFFADGSATSHGLVYITGGDQTVSVRVNRWTGAAAIDPYTAGPKAGPAEDAPPGATGTTGDAGAWGESGTVGSPASSGSTGPTSATGGKR